ncbi:Ig-like domain-containing protein [Piscinibacter sp.]|uniref:Ig-like domain-containing protein n=1 Tax=Piscinibacter sp. TaxID=1903157 RepID=UPI00355991F6
MNQFHNLFKSPIGLIPALLAAFMAGCGPGIAPIITATSPVVSAPLVTGVATNSRVFATFSQPMAAATLTPTSFMVACPAGTPVTATVGYDAATQTATLTPNPALPPSTLCVATVTTAAQDNTGLALASNFVWSFTTAALADTTRPTVILTVPAAAASNVPNNAKITAAFSEDMDVTTMSGTSFTVANAALGAPVAGTVSYSAAARTATFTPSTPITLANNTSFTATITTAATDLAGNALAGTTAALPNGSNHVWTFATAAVGDTTAAAVTAISPADGTGSVCLAKTVSATFSEPMDAATINATTFSVSDNGVAVAGNVTYDAPSRVASFVPSNAAGFAASRPFVATIMSGSAGVKDLAGNALAGTRVWGFTTGTQPCRRAVNLRTAALFGAFGAAGVTNQGINTVVNGNLGTTAACTLITGFNDAANVYTQTTLNSGAVNGSVYCAPPAPGNATTMAIATQARADALSAYDDLAAMPPGSDPGAGQLGGRVLTAAVYTSAGGSFAITTGDLTLDAQGDANAMWVFQSASSLTVGLSATPRRVLLINGAQAKNVIWQVGSAARIEDGGAMVGTIIALSGVTISTAGQTAQTTLTGRALGLTASVTMVNTTIVAP